MGCSNLWARLKIMCHVRQPIYYTRYISPLCAYVLAHVSMGLRLNRSETSRIPRRPPPFLPSFVRSFVRSSASSSSSGFLRTAARLVQRKIEAIIPARICSYPFENSFYERNVPVAMRVFVIRRGWYEMRFVEEGCTREGDYIFHFE